MPKSLVGLEISARYISAVEVAFTRRSASKVLKVAVREIPQDIAKDSEVVDIVSLSSELRKFWQESGFDSKNVVLGLGNQRVLVRDLSVPAMPMHQLKSALPFLVEDLLPVPVSETILDFYPIAEIPESDPPHMSGLLVAAIQSNVDALVATVQDAGLKTHAVDLAPFAVVRALAKSGQLEGACSVVHLGDHSSFIVIVKDGIPQFVRIIPTGRAMISEVATLENQQPVDVEASQPSLLRHAFRALSSSIVSTNSYYLNNYSADAIDKIVLTGSGARSLSVKNTLENLTNLPVEFGDVIAGSGVSIGALSDSAAQQLERSVVALGLAIGEW